LRDVGDCWDRRNYPKTADRCWELYQGLMTNVATNTTCLEWDEKILVAGVDEVGRGCIFGDVVAAAVIVKPSGLQDLQGAGVTDSKKLTAARREALVPVIHAHALSWGIGVATVAEISQWDILTASLLAMERAIAQLDPQPEHCLVDGNQRLRFQEIAPLPQTTLIKGDSRSLAIGAASILAKVYRDGQMVALGREYPEYGLAENKGYGTLRHRQAIAKFGYTSLHRWGFQIKLPM